jgi:hypothetical protein
MLFELFFTERLRVDRAKANSEIAALASGL